MRLRRGFLRPQLVAVCCLAACLWLAAAPALAQTINLTAANVERMRNGGARLVLTFSSGPPKYQVYGNGTTQVTVMLMATAPAANAPTAIPGVGPIATGQISVVGTATTIVLYAREPATLQVTRGSGQTLLVDILSASAATPSATAPPPLAPQPAVPAQGVVTKVVLLKYADVSEIVGILSGTSIAPNMTSQAQPSTGNFGSPSTLGAGGSGFGTSTSPTVSFAGVTGAGEGTQQESAGQRINDSIAIDRRLNAIILTGTPDQIARYEAIIDAVDIPLRSVMLQTEIVELTDRAATDVGIDYTNGATGQIGSVTFTTANVGSQNQLNLQAAIFAQVLKGNGRIIATPRILALDGKPASILTGDALPILTSITVSGVNAVQQQVQYVNVGVNLQILARSTSDGYVTAQVYSAVSSVTGYTASYPNIAQRQASTTVTVRDGQSFVLGGLLEKNELNSLSKIPVLGDLPLIGSLFRVRHNSSSTDNLYIVVTPQIIERGGPSPSPSPTSHTL
jgi:general secretion pathway protein D